MAIQHRDIPESELHEPKGASTAAAGTVYTSTGNGSGTWKKIDTDAIEGLGSQQGREDWAVLATGQGGFKYTPLTAYGSIVINNNASGFPVTAASDNTLNTNSDYKILTGAGAPWQPDLSYGLSVAADGLTVLQNGIYKIESWMDIVGFPTNTARLAMKYLVNDNIYGLRKISAKSNSNGDAGSLTGFGLVELSEGDTVRVVVASTESGNIIFESGNITLSLVRAL